MSEISEQQVLDLMLEISRGVVELEASIDELLIDVRVFNQELAVDRWHLMQQVCFE